MKVTKTIAALSLTAASTSAFGLMMPPVKTKTVCLDQFETNDGSLRLGTCDQSKNNRIKHLPKLENGCAEGQAAMTVQKWEQNAEFFPNIPLCLPPNVAQL
jgi:hypothetical protein